MIQFSNICSKINTILKEQLSRPEIAYHFQSNQEEKYKETNKENGRQKDPIFIFNFCHKLMTYPLIFMV
jgi:hypothetical protein